VSEGIKVGKVVEAVVFKITEFGAFCNLKGGRRGLIHISQVSDDFVKNVSDHLKLGDKIRAKIVRITDDGKIDLSLRRREKPTSAPFNSVLEEKLKKHIASQ